MWNNTHLLIFTLHWDYLQLLKYFQHLTITAVIHGGRNCHVFNTKQEVLLYKSRPVNKKYQPLRELIYGNLSPPSQTNQILLILLVFYHYCDRLHVDRSWFIKHYLQNSLSHRLCVQNNVHTLIWQTLTIHFPEKYTSGNLR